MLTGKRTIARRLLTLRIARKRHSRLAVIIAALCGVIVVVALNICYDHFIATPAPKQTMPSKTNTVRQTEPEEQTAPPGLSTGP
jgi:hypothetical protein